MKKLLIATLSLGLLMAVPGFAQDQSSSSSGASGSDASKSSASSDTSKSGKSSAKLKSITGKISDDGQSFTSDKDSSKKWTIMNPEAVKGHEGHHVKLSAHVYPDKDSVHVMSVKMAAEKGAKSDMKSDTSSSSGSSTTPK
jgi:hypothetical protein